MVSAFKRGLKPSVSAYAGGTTLLPSDEEEG